MYSLETIHALEREELKRAKNSDVTVRNEGTIFLFTPRTDLAQEWLANNIGEDSLWFGQSLVVEHRYARDLARAMVADGLEVK